MQIAHTVALDHQQAISAVTAALAEQGVGVLTTIDIKADPGALLGIDSGDQPSSARPPQTLAHARAEPSAP
ncbi:MULTISPECIES: hypothetical protein [Pseudonocardia]|uniref:Uncharacterized protein n=4 Tax=Pseudonocardia TaxID=1847 RepID=A0A1I5H458_PSUAM|nr:MULTISPECIES: hypothetical protein [Pseudonocardia]MBP2371499.1 hypothetical protein [Pseudonocardia parietis]OSY34421.1 hypothetical protein BG845_06877 [Pseudonocardia autotrophica]TDN65515.1 hypothetical protein C8E95_7007 [Pseudonocardia autotrophica]SFO43045.1 hypothetical protein SAMN05216207_10575 [Pseudonocardia ammonioxydans]BBG05640.1 hypothetical protein Pdca_68490 [Pseudonocardia autotrophica]